MTTRAQLLLGALTVFFLGLFLGLGLGIANASDVCAPLDSGKIDTVGDPLSVTVSAPEGYLIDGYCVKAGSSKQGLGPVYVDVDPPQATITITYPDGKAVSHYALSYTEVPPSSTTTTSTTTTTEPPTTTSTSTTTTTVSPTSTSTTTVPEVTTTTVDPSTTTTSTTLAGTTTTTEPPGQSTTTTIPTSSTSSPPDTPTELPRTGAPLGLFAAAGLATLVLGALTLYASRQDQR